MTQHAFIYDAVRTPRGKGKRDGSLHEVKAVDLLAGALRAIRDRNNLDTSRVDDIIMGCVTAIGDQGADIAKTAAFVADWDEKVAGVTLNRFCASGLEAVNQAAARIRSGWEDLIVAGGVESMSRVPMGSDGGAWALDPGTNLKTAFVPQGISADLIATIEHFSRDDLDRFALSSQSKAAAAWADKRFSRSIVPVVDGNGLVVLAHDELVRPDTSIEALGGLKPSFQMMGEMGFDAVVRDKYPWIERIDHQHTPGNSSGIVDGAAAVLIGSETLGRSLELRPRGRIVSAAVTSTDPTIMLTGPAPAARIALERAGLTVADIDLFEVNEAFASVVLKFQRELDVPMDRINVNGGSIAMGHPLGATGAMLVSTLLDELEARQQRYGLITLCVGGGMGIATIIERSSEF